MGKKAQKTGGSQMAAACFSRLGKTAPNRLRIIYRETKLLLSP